MDLLKDKRQKDWFWIENQIIDNEELTIYEKMIYMVLARHANEGSSCFPSHKTIAKKAGCSERQVRNVIPKLEEKGLVKKVARKRKGSKENDNNIYFVLSCKNLNETKDNEISTECGAVPTEYDAVQVGNGVPYPTACGAVQVGHVVPGNNTKLNNTNINSRNNIFDDNSNEFRLSKFLLENIKKNNPNMKEPNLQTWSKEFDYILRLDKRNLNEVKEIIVWCHQEDNFWSGNILSPKSLRKHFDKLRMQKQLEHRKSSSNCFEDSLNGFEQY